MNIITLETRVAGGEGSKYVDGTASPSEVTGLRNFMIVAREDGTKITSITGKDKDDNTIDVLAEFGLTSSIELYKGEDFYTRMDVVITAIDVSTGSVKLN